MWSKNIMHNKSRVRWTKWSTRSILLKNSIAITFNRPVWTAWHALISMESKHINVFLISSAHMQKIYKISKCETLNSMRKAYNPSVQFKEQQ